MKPVQKIVWGFFLAIFIGGLLLSLPICSSTGESVGLLNGMFTATTSVCVTGLVTVDTGTAYSHVGHFVILCLIQLGGLGFMTMVTIVFMMIRKRITLKERMLIQEAMNQDSLQGMVRLIQNVVLITILIETLGAICLSFSFVPKFGLKTGLFYSIFISISAFCNAGLDPLGNFQSLTGYTGDAIVNLTVMALIILGGLGFTVIRDVWRNKRWKKFPIHTKLVLGMTAALVLGGTFLFTLIEWNNPATMAAMPAGEKIMAGAFQSVTTRTAGFNSIDQNGLYGGSFSFDHYFNVHRCGARVYRRRYQGNYICHSFACNGRHCARTAGSGGWQTQHWKGFGTQCGGHCRAGHGIGADSDLYHLHHRRRQSCCNDGNDPI